MRRAGQWNGGPGDGPSGPGEPDDRQDLPRPVWRRPTTLALAAILAVVAIAVVTDLPGSPSLANERVNARSTVQTIASDVLPCTVAVTEAFTIYRDESNGTLSRSDRSQAPGILADDENGCSYTSQSIVNLASMNFPGSSGAKLAAVGADALNWADPDGLSAINDITALLDHPHEAIAETRLHSAEDRLRSDRAAAEQAVSRISRALGSPLPSVGLPRINP